MKLELGVDKLGLNLRWRLNKAVAGSMEWWPCHVSIRNIAKVDVKLIPVKDTINTQR